MKKYTFTIIISLLVLFCILFPESMINSAKNGLSLWVKIILPSLFPFLILSNLITKTALPKIFGTLLDPIIKFLFNLPGISALPLFLGMTGGYPIGAKVTSDLRQNNLISKNTANRLIAFTNNSGPLFITGAIGIGLYKNSKIGLLLLLVHYLSAIIVGLILRFKKDNSTTKNTTNINFEIITLSKLGTTLNEAIQNAITSILGIGGFIILFSIISTILFETGIINLISNTIFPFLNKTTSFSLISGLLEVTNGINNLYSAQIPLLQKLVFTSILLGFGGFSIHMQTLSILSKTDIKISSYITGKSLQAIISGILTYLALIYTSFSNILLTPVFNKTGDLSYETNIIFDVLLGFSIFIILFKILQLIIKTKK